MVSKINKVTYLVVLVHGKQAESRKRKKVGGKKKKEKKKELLFIIWENQMTCASTRYIIRLLRRIALMMWQLIIIKLSNN